MASRDYWVEISSRGKRLGGGFVLTRHHVLTASHCLRGTDAEDEDVDLSFAGGDVTPGRVCERAPEADLALIDIVKPRDTTVVVPKADRAGRGDKWTAPYRPSTADPYLSGAVLSGGITYQCEAGTEIEALQLGCSQRLGDYSGYSGGPVERHVTGRDSALLGVLLEQYPDRHATGRASDVLFAATIAEALRCFDCLGVGHLLEVLFGNGGTPPERTPLREFDQDPGESPAGAPGFHSPSVGSRIANANSLLGALHEWGASGVLDPVDASVMKRQVVQRIVDSNWADGL